MTDNYCSCNEPTTKYYIKINQQGPRGIPGQTGATGETGAKGFSPQIQVIEDDVDHYVLRFIDEDNTYLSPNLLKGALAYTKEESNARYYTKTYIDTTLANYDTITNVNSKLATKLDKTTYDTDKPTFALKTELPSMASTTALGLIKVGDTLTITTDGVLNVGPISYNDLTDKPTIPDAYTLPAATATTLGGIKVGNNLTITEDGTLNATGGTGGDTPIATTTTVGTVKPDGTTIIITADGTISAVSTATVTDKYGIQGDYSTHYGILDCPNGLIEYNATGYGITVKNGIILQAAGNATRTTIASDITYTIQEHNQELVLFYAEGNILEAGDVFYQVDESENGTVGYAAWFNPVLGKWKFKSTDTGNVWREAVATPIANVKTGAEGILTLNYIGYRILDDDIIAQMSDVDTLQETITTLTTTVNQLTARIEQLETLINGGTANA